MRTRHDAAGSSNPESEIEHMRIVGWRVLGPLGFESVSIMARDSNGNTFDEVAMVVAGNAVSSLVERDEDWNLVDIPLSRKAKCALFSVSLYSQSDAMLRVVSCCSR